MAIESSQGSIATGRGTRVTLQAPSRGPGDVTQFVSYSDYPATPATTTNYTKVVDEGGFTVWEQRLSTHQPAGTATLTFAGDGAYSAFFQVFRDTSPDTPTDPRQALVLGVDKPTTSTTGVRSGSALTVTSSHSPVSGGVYENLEIRNVVDLGSKSNVTYRNCWFRGAVDVPASNNALVRAWGSSNGRGHLFEDCTFQPQAPHYRWNGILGYGFTARRCLFVDNTDHIGLYNNNGTATTKSGPLDVVIEQCYFGANGWWDSTVDVGGGPIGSHCDQIQYQGGSAVSVRGNTFTGKIGQQYGPNSYGDYNTNTVVMLKPDVGLITGLVMERNWIDGGRVSVNIANDAPDRILGNIGAVRDNRFGRSQGQPTSTPATITMPSNVTGDFSGNVYEDDGTPVTVRRNW